MKFYDKETGQPLSYAYGRCGDATFSAGPNCEVQTDTLEQGYYTVFRNGYGPAKAYYKDQIVRLEKIFPRFFAVDGLVTPADLQSIRWRLVSTELGNYVNSTLAVAESEPFHGSIERTFYSNSSYLFHKNGEPDLKEHICTNKTTSGAYRDTYVICHYDEAQLNDCGTVLCNISYNPSEGNWTYLNGKLIATIDNPGGDPNRRVRIYSYQQLA